MSNKLFEAIYAHAEKDAPNECCGLIVKCGKKSRTIPAKNIADKPRSTFDLDPDAWLEVKDDEEVIGIYHSHCYQSADPSEADKVACELTQLPWHIVSFPSGGYVVHEPNGYQAPYKGRPYVHGVLDCYTLIRDWYAREMNHEMPNFDRRYDWWHKGENLYVDNYEEQGFVRLPEGSEFQYGDLIYIQFRSPVPNHAAVYIGNGQILHHPEGRMSGTDPYGGMWLKHTVMHLRLNKNG